MKLEMMKNKHEGKLITFCGLDGCGKTTQINRLERWLTENGHRVFLTKQPTPFVRNSEMFRTYMDMPNHDEFDYRALSLLCASDRVQHSNREITQKLREGYIVISDRYFYSCLANLIARGYVNDQWIYDVAKSIPEPDVAFFMNAPVEVAVSRVRSRPEEKDRYIDLELENRLHDLYIDIARDNKGVIISTVMPIESCFERVRYETNRMLNRGVSEDEGTN